MATIHAPKFGLENLILAAVHGMLGALFHLAHVVGCAKSSKNQQQKTCQTHTNLKHAQPLTQIASVS